MKPVRYDPATYWEELLAGDFTLSGVSHPYLPGSFNRLLYRAMERSLRRALRAAPPPRPLEECDVLDVGSGVGFWLDVWRSLGVRRLTGIDLTATAVDRLAERLPDVAVHRLDIGDDVGALGAFDLVSVVNVLLHLTDDTRFGRAVANLGRLVRPGGTLLVIDPIVVHRVRHDPPSSGANSKPRPLAEWEAAAAAAGLELVHLGPVTVLLDEPVDTRTRAGRGALAAYWPLLLRAVNRRPALGRLAAAADTALVRLAATGPSLKCAAFRR